MDVATLSHMKGPPQTHLQTHLQQLLLQVCFPGRTAIGRVLTHVTLTIGRVLAHVTLTIGRVLTHVTLTIGRVLTHFHTFMAVYQAGIIA